MGAGTERDDELVAALAPSEVESFNCVMSWRDISPDGDVSFLTADVRAGRVIGIQFSEHRLWPRIAAMFGKPALAGQPDDVQWWIWRRTPGVMLGHFASSDPYTVPKPFPPTRANFPTRSLSASRSPPAGHDAEPVVRPRLCTDSNGCANERRAGRERAPA
ncbi:MAG: hypothetical protein ABI591_12890 [Kofleriaceae bacterium]